MHAHLRKVADAAVIALLESSAGTCEAGPPSSGIRTATRCSWNSAARASEENAAMPTGLGKDAPTSAADYSHVVIGGNLVLVNRINFQIADVFHLEIY